MARRKFSEGREARRLGLVLAVLSGGLGAYLALRGHPLAAAVCGGVAATAGVGAGFLPRWWLGFFRVWMLFATGLSWFTTRLILSAFFYLVLTPFGVLRGLFGKSALETAWKEGSYWIDKPPGKFTIERYRRQY